MIIKMTLKDPDGINDAIKETAEKSVEKLELNKEEKKLLIAHRLEAINKELSKWIDCGDYVNIEFNTATGNAIIIELKDL